MYDDSFRQLKPVNLRVSVTVDVKMFLDTVKRAKLQVEVAEKTFQLKLLFRRIIATNLFFSV